jgi:SAM-dependent methyltransferase
MHESSARMPELVNGLVLGGEVWDNDEIGTIQVLVSNPERRVDFWPTSPVGSILTDEPVLSVPWEPEWPRARWLAALRRSPRWHAFVGESTSLLDEPALAVPRRDATDSECRQWLVSGLGRRDVVEIAAGCGANFVWYPLHLTSLVAVEQSRRAASRMHTMSWRTLRPVVDVRVIVASAERLPLRDRSADVVVMALGLCSIGDPARALAEIHRVLRPDGELRFYEHVQSPGPRGVGQRHADAHGWPDRHEGCHLARRSLVAIRDAGFDVVDSWRCTFARGDDLPAVQHVLGVAKP